MIKLPQIFVWEGFRPAFVLRFFGFLGYGGSYPITYYYTVVLTVVSLGVDAMFSESKSPTTVFVDSSSAPLAARKWS